ncbi:hypothetical protein F5Y17DRAFT_178335 [Xylariaceae sp. FL0594]|nr:hypothetical protein F5Y17DRAFT_178335 [Xylariaceae sp. FL0594]
MAPMGPKKNGPAAGRNAKSNNAKKTTTDKASTRNGISKRRGPTTRVDRDGDLSMDSLTASKGAQHKNHPAPSTNKPRAPPRNPKAASKTKQVIERVLNGNHDAIASQVTTRTHASRNGDSKPLVTLRVEGLKASKAGSNEGGGLRELLAFLERKASSCSGNTRTVRIKKSQLRGDFVFVTATQEDAEEILKVNNFMFAGATLQITLSQDHSNGAPLSSDAQEIKMKLQNVLEQRYVGSARLLNLSTLGEDPTLREMGFFSGESTPEKMFRALMAVCDGFFKSAQEKRDAVVSIALAGNNITDVGQIDSLTDTFPDVVNLDLSRNQIRDIRALQRWRHRLRSAETVLLNDNPIEVNSPDYKAELVKWFPRLMNLSGAQVRTPEQVAAAATIRVLPQGGADFRDINGIGESFIKEFIPMYDADRLSLAAKYYDERSTFSLAINTASPHDPSVPTAQWGPYMKHSRNHKRITHQATQRQRVCTGVNAIQALWQELPRTQHPDLMSQLDLYIVDCHPVHGLEDPSGQSPTGVDGMIIYIHGVFEDQEPGSTKTAKRAFSRTILLGPGAPGRNPIRVISDMLALKAYAPVPLPTIIPAAVDSGAEQRKQEMLVELGRQTGMNLEFSRLCLENANWDFAQALASFNEKKASLPAAAFTAV